MRVFARDACRTPNPKLSRWSWAGAAPRGRPAASRPRACRASSAAPPRCRRQGQLQQGLAALGAADGHGVHGAQPLHVAVLRVEAPRRVGGARNAPASSIAFTRRSVKSLLCWNLSALSCSTLNSVAGRFSTSSGAPYTVSCGRAL